MLIAAATGCDPRAIGQSSARPPLRPVPMRRLPAISTIDDLPMPAAGPAMSRQLYDSRLSSWRRHHGMRRGLAGDRGRHAHDRVEQNAIG